MSDTNEIFARLEVVAGRQILAEIVNGDEGPIIRVRRDMDLSIEVTIGPWGDDDDGWDEADAKLRSLDLTKYAAHMDVSLAAFHRKASQE